MHMITVQYTFVYTQIVFIRIMNTCLQCTAVAQISISPRKQSALGAEINIILFLFI